METRIFYVEKVPEFFSSQNPQSGPWTICGLGLTVLPASGSLLNLALVILVDIIHCPCLKFGFLVHQWQVLFWQLYGLREWAVLFKERGEASAFVSHLLGVKTCHNSGPCELASWLQHIREKFMEKIRHPRVKVLGEIWHHCLNQIYLYSSVYIRNHYSSLSTIASAHIPEDPTWSLLLPLPPLLHLGRTEKLISPQLKDPCFCSRI